MEPTWGPPGSCRPRAGPHVGPVNLLSGIVSMLVQWCLRPQWNSMPREWRHTLDVQFKYMCTAKGLWIINIKDLNWVKKECWSWWHHQMETFSTLLAFCVGNSPVTGEFPSQRPVTWSFDVFFDLCLNKLLIKQSWDWWFETPSRSLWHHCNGTLMNIVILNMMYVLQLHGCILCRNIMSWPTMLWLDLTIDCFWQPSQYQDVTIHAQELTL